MEPEEFNEEERYRYYTTMRSEYDVNGLVSEMISSISSSMIGKEFFSKLLGARVRVSWSCNSDEFYFYSYCEHCAYKTICDKLPDDILLSDGCFCSLTGRKNGMYLYSVIEQIYPVEELEKIHKALLEINQSYFENNDEKVNLMKLLINLEYLKYNNENDK